MSGLASRLYVADTSVWERRRNHVVREALQAAIREELVLGTPIVAMEMAFGARDLDELEGFESRYALLQEARIDRGVVEAARGAQRELAAAGPLHHRVPVTDLLIAAAAASRGVGVLHCDRHFDRLASVLGFESRWIAEPGAL